MGGKRKKETAYIPASSSDYEDKTPEQDKKMLETLKQKYDSSKCDIPPLSEREREHLTYLMVTAKFNEARNKRSSAKKYGSLFIVISGIVFLTLMFSLEAKIQTLCLWIVTIIYCVVVMLKAEYNYQNYKEILGIADEDDYCEMDEEEEAPPAKVTASEAPPIAQPEAMTETYNNME